MANVVPAVNAPPVIRFDVPVGFLSNVTDTAGLNKHQSFKLPVMPLICIPFVAPDHCVLADVPPDTLIPASAVNTPPTYKALATPTPPANLAPPVVALDESVVLVPTSTSSVVVPVSVRLASETTGAQFVVSTDGSVTPADDVVLRL